MALFLIIIANLRYVLTRRTSDGGAFIEGEWVERYDLKLLFLQNRIILYSSKYFVNLHEGT
jgi:hypothetical protein